MVYMYIHTEFTKDDVRFIIALTWSRQDDFVNSLQLIVPLCRKNDDIRK